MVIIHAQNESRALKHNYIGVEHLLLGLILEHEGLAARTLETLGVEADKARDAVRRFIGEGDAVTPGQIPFTPRAKKVLEGGLREALSLGHNYVGTEHVLLSLLRETEGAAAKILSELEIGAENVREAIIIALSSPGKRQRQAASDRYEQVLMDARLAEAAMRKLIASLQVLIAEKE